jgi:hypothetical protein
MSVRTAWQRHRFDALQCTPYDETLPIVSVFVALTGSAGQSKNTAEGGCATKH